MQKCEVGSFNLHHIQKLMEWIKDLNLSTETIKTL